MSNCGFWGPNWRPEWQFGVLGAKFGGFGVRNRGLGSNFGVLGSNFGVFLGRKKARFLGVEWPEFDEI